MWGLNTDKDFPAEVLCLLYFALEFICIIKKKKNNFCRFFIQLSYYSFIFIFAIKSIFFQVNTTLYWSFETVPQVCCFLRATSAFFEHSYSISKPWCEVLATCMWVVWRVIFFLLLVIKGCSKSRQEPENPEISMYFRCIMSSSYKDCSNFGEIGCDTLVWSWPASSVL